MADQLKYTTATLLWAGMNYELSKKYSIGAGFTYKGDRELDALKNAYDDFNENPLYEQYIFTTHIHSLQGQIRTRLEQRFVREEGQRLFSQRARLFLATQIPLIRTNDFKQGWYTVLQNEVFVNVQHQERVNDRFFDQNRLYAALGFRFNPHIELEGGHMLWTQKESVSEWRNVYQLKLTTEF